MFPELLFLTAFFQAKRFREIDPFRCGRIGDDQMNGLFFLFIAQMQIILTHIEHVQRISFFIRTAQFLLFNERAFLFHADLDRVQDRFVRFFQIIGRICGNRFTVFKGPLIFFQREMVIGGAAGEQQARNQKYIRLFHFITSRALYHVTRQNRTIKNTLWQNIPKFLKK